MNKNNDIINNTLNKIIDNYQYPSLPMFHMQSKMPNKGEIIKIIKDIRKVIFPEYYDEKACQERYAEYYIGQLLADIHDNLRTQIALAMNYRKCSQHMSETIDEQADEITDRFFAKLPIIQEKLLKDVVAAFDGDPAAKSKEEIIFAYPGLLAIFVYRIAHELYVENVPFIPRIMTEYAHSRTGIDINSGAVIGDYFFIDHGTGVVIGETCVIGDNVKIYQGVTLGALSTRNGQKLAGKKRHPTVENNVTIYANASILGGDTVIGENSTIGGNSFTTQSIPKNSKISSTI